MATSSLFHHFVIEGEENVKRFIDAFDESWEAQGPSNFDYEAALLEELESIELVKRQCEAIRAKEQEAQKIAK